MNFRMLGQDHFWNDGNMLSSKEFKIAYGRGLIGYNDYLEGFFEAWEEHDKHISRRDNPESHYDPYSWKGHAKGRDIFP